MDAYSALNINVENLCYGLDYDFQDFSNDASHPDILTLGDWARGKPRIDRFALHLKAS